MTGTSDPIEADPTSGQRPDAGLEPVPTSPIPSWIATLDTGYFAVVMATGILAVGTRALGFPLLAAILVWCTAAAFAVLTIAYLARAIAFPHRFAQSLRRPSSAVGYFTLVAGTNVLAVCLSAYGMWLLALILGALAALVWTLLNYGLLYSIVLAGNRPRLRDIGGGWLIWVVATQSISVLATALAAHIPTDATRAAFAMIGAVSWSIGVVLYLVFVVIIFLRMLTTETTPAEMGPGYWILMGATAISARAGAGLLELDTGQHVQLLHELRPFESGISFALWSFGNWFIPLLILIGIWRHVIHRYSSRYEPSLWSVVFPLGMYTVASFALGGQLHVGFLVLIARGWLWLGLCAWLGVLVLMVFARRRPTTPAAPRGRPPE